MLLQFDLHWSTITKKLCKSRIFQFLPIRDAQHWNYTSIPRYVGGWFASYRKLNGSVNHISPVGSVVRAVAVPREPPEPWYLPAEKIKQKLEILFRMNQEIHHISWIIMFVLQIKIFAHVHQVRLGQKISTGFLFSPCGHCGGVG